MQINSKRIIIALGFLAVLAGCAKVVSEGTNVANKRYLEAYMATHHPDADKVGLGIYILHDEEGKGEEINDSSYLFCEYQYSDLATGEILAYSDETIAKQLGDYDVANDYSPYIFLFQDYTVSQGLQDMINGGKVEGKSKSYGKMRIGGTRTAVLPGWLSSTYYFYDTEKDYLDNVSSTANYVYSMKIIGQTQDITQWQIDTIERFMDKTGSRVDSVKYHKGLYYIRNKAAEAARKVTVAEDYSFPDDTTIYINYVGRLLSGKVFDTNIKDTAKVWNIYSSSKTYEPQEITWSADSTAIQMASSDIITGFAYTLWQMHPYESGRGIFISDLGYQDSGSGKTIPAYAPLIFDIDIVDNPDD